MAEPRANGSSPAPPRDEMFRRLVESVRDYAIFMLDREGRISSWNAGAQRIKGYTAAEAIGQHFSIFYPPAAAESGWPQEELRRATESGRYEEEGWRVRKDGTRFWASVVITAMRDESGALLGFAKVTRDLTERRRYEEQLKRSEESLRMLVDGVKDHAIFLLDAVGAVSSWNAGAQRVLGHASEDVLGHGIEIFYTEDDRRAGRPQQELAAARHTGLYEVEDWRVKADGTQVWAGITLTALADAEGRVTGFVQILQDLSERRRVHELETEGRRIHEFIAMLSHELRNPLAPIGNAARILQRSGSKSEAAWCADVISRQVQHLTRLVDDLLDVSRVTSGKIQLQTQPLELNTLVQLAVDGVRAQVEGYEHVLELQLAQQPIFVSGDPTRLTQVVANLLSNAAKYTPRGGHIRLVVERERAIATLQVIDNGIGMSEALMQRAFEPFVQGDRGLARSEGGLGIGLTLVKSIVDMHGGAVMVASPGPGQGTRFTVTLPLAPSSAPAVAADNGVAAGDGRASADLILVVDDNHDAANSYAMLLRMSGHEVSVAHDGAQALRMAAERPPGLVLLDLGLPGMDGYEVARRLRALPGLHSVRLIAMTGYGQPSDRDRTARAGFEAHLVKPVDFDELMRLIA